jgi:hypothetical protein
MEEIVSRQLRHLKRCHVRFGSFVTDPFSASADQYPLRTQQRPNFAAQRNDAKCQKRTSPARHFGLPHRLVGLDY